MKTITAQELLAGALYLSAVLWLSPVLSAAQIVNGSFELDGQSSLDGWSFTCHGGVSFQEAPPGGGTWSLKLEPGNVQGCFPSVATQTVPGIQSGEVWRLTAWVRQDTATFTVASLYWQIVPSGGTSGTLPADTTTARGWTQLTVVDTLFLAPGDSAMIVLDAGRTGGPELEGSGYLFDLVSAERIDGTPVLNEDLSQDSLALVALYHATGGANWTDNTNWLTAPVSQWKGVSVTGDRVTVLDLEDNDLTAEIPSELGNLTNLDSLNLSYNELTGEIPSELGNLTNLTALVLDSNQLTGPIPPELGNLTNLTVLWLPSNPLIGTLPLSLINLAVLNSFWFNNTALCVPIDPAFQTWLQGINELRSTGCTNVATEDAAEIPMDFALEQNYPNPFGPGWSGSQTGGPYPATVIRYALPQRAPVRLVVYDVQGRRVAVLVEAEQSAGRYAVRFEAGALPSGVYMYRLEAGVFQEMRQMILLK